MAKEPASRYPDAQAVAHALLPFASYRTQVTHGPDLQSRNTLGATEPSIAVPAAPLPIEPSTLSPTAHSVATQRPAATLGWRLPLLLVAVAIAGLALLWKQTAAPQAVPVALPPVAVPPRSIQPPESPPSSIATSPIVPIKPVTAPVVAVPPAQIARPVQPPAAANRDAGAPKPSAPTTVRRGAKPERARKPASAAPATSERPQPSHAAEDVWGDRK
jgi:hypothetical protein